MTLPSGLAAQLGIATETTPGTAVTVTRFFPLVDESMGSEIERLESAGIIAGARVQRSAQWSGGKKNPNGSVGLELPTVGLGLWLKHMFGGIATAGAGPYTHTATPGDLSGVAFTLQVGKPDITGVVQPFTYAGCKVSSWEIACTAGEIATLGVDVVAMSETTATALASASYASGVTTPFTFVQGALTLAGAAFPVKSATVAGDNGLADDRYFLGSATRSEPLENALRAHTGTLTAEFSGLTAYNRFVNGTEAALVLTFTAGAQILAITQNVRFDGETPKVGGPDIVEQSLPYKAVGASTDAGAITAVFTTSEATP